MRGLQGKSVIVVAAGSNTERPSLGGSVATRLAAEGALVTVADLDLAAAERTVERISAAGGTAVARQVDASDEASVNAAIAFAVETHGGLHGVHFNAMDMSAGTLGVDGEHDLVTLPLAVWQRTLDVGLTGFLLTARAAIPHLVAAGGGGIVGTASAAVYASEPIRVAYAATKTGMTAVARHIASAYGKQKVRANCVAPGMVLPGAALENDDPKFLAMVSARAGRPGSPDDIAAMVTFLLSDDGSWITGQVLSVDGGALPRA